MTIKKRKKTTVKKTLIEKAIVQSVELTRYSVSGDKINKNNPVMKSQGELAYIDKGISTWKLDLAKIGSIHHTKTKTPHVRVRADWLDTQQALESNVKVIHGGSANSFGGMGALLLPDNFSIPTVLANSENVKHYDLQLIKNKDTFAISSNQYQIAMMKYEYGKEYKKDFLMQKHGGGGIFVETHNFPHIHIPLSEDSGGYIVIGKKLADGKYDFTAFQIPYGYALYTPSYTIHGDGTLVGEFALTLADSAMCHADTVLMYNKKTKRMARNIVPNWKK